MEREERKNKKGWKEKKEKDKKSWRERKGKTRKAGKRRKRKTRKVGERGKEKQERLEREERERQEKLEREEKERQERLKGYELVPEVYRQNFRNCEKFSSQTHVEFSRSKEQLFDRWCHSQKVDKSYNRFRQIIMDVHSQ